MGSAALKTPLTLAFEIVVNKPVVLHSHCSNIAQEMPAEIKVTKNVPTVK